MVDRIVGAGIAALGALYWYLADHLREPLLRQPVGPDVFPKLLAVTLVALGVALIVRSLLRRSERREPAGPTAGSRGDGEDAVAVAARAVTEVLHQDTPARLDYRTMLLAAVGLVLYALTYEPLGFLLATFLFVVYETAVMESRRGHWVRTILAAALLSAGIYLLFVRVLDVVLPPGLLG